MIRDDHLTVFSVLTFYPVWFVLFSHCFSYGSCSAAELRDVLGPSVETTVQGCSNLTSILDL